MTINEWIEKHLDGQDPRINIQGRFHNQRYKNLQYSYLMKAFIKKKWDGDFLDLPWEEEDDEYRILFHKKYRELWLKYHDQIMSKTNIHTLKLFRGYDEFHSTDLIKTKEFMDSRKTSLKWDQENNHPTGDDLNRRLSTRGLKINIIADIIIKGRRRLMTLRKYEAFEQSPIFIGENYKDLLDRLEKDTYE